MEKLKKIKTKLKSTKGDIGFMGIALVLICIMILAVGIEYLKALAIIQSVSDSLQEAVVCVATDNANSAFDGVREGNSSAHKYDGDKWIAEVKTSDVENKLVSAMSLKKQGTKYIKFAQNGIANFSISNITVDYANVTVGDKGNAYTLSFSASCDLELSYIFLGVNIPITKKIVLHSTYIPLF